MTPCRYGCSLLALSTLLAHSHISGYEEGRSGEAPQQPLECHLCNAEGSSCNEGLCRGFGCVVIEAVYESEVITRKQCLAERPTRAEAKCVRQDLLDHLQAVRCICFKPFCNSDASLQAAGMRPVASSGGKARRGRGIRVQERALTVNYVLMLLFVGSFVAFSMTLLVVNTVCSYVC